MLLELCEGVAGEDIFADGVDIIMSAGKAAESGAAEHGADAAAGGFFIRAADDIARLRDIDVAGQDAEVEGGKEGGNGYACGEERVPSGEVERFLPQARGVGLNGCDNSCLLGWSRSGSGSGASNFRTCNFRIRLRSGRGRHELKRVVQIGR